MSFSISHGSWGGKANFFFNVIHSKKKMVILRTVHWNFFGGQKQNSSMESL